MHGPLTINRRISLHCRHRTDAVAPPPAVISAQPPPPPPPSAGRAVGAERNSGLQQVADLTSSQREEKKTLTDGVDVKCCGWTEDVKEEHEDLIIQKTVLLLETFCCWKQAVETYYLYYGMAYT